MVAALLGIHLGVAAAAPPALTPAVVGEPPNGGGVFRFPQAVGFTPGGGTVFVGDQFSGVVQAFSADGAFKFAFGSRASRREAGRLGVVGGVAVDRSGHVYVLDSENDRVQVFDAADGTFRTAFGDTSVFDLTSGTVPGPDGGISASGVTVWQATPTASPIVFVADQGNDRVERFVLDATTLTPTGPPQFSSPSLGLNFPQGITTDAAGTRLYVADDDNHRVVVLDPQTLAFVAQVGSFGTGPGQFQNPYDVAVDARAPFQLYVADNLNNRVDVFDAATLASVGTFGGFGRTPGLFSIVRAVGAIADDPRGGVDVADTANNRVQALDATGAVLGAWGLAGRGAGYVTRPGGVAFDPAGGIAVADTFDHRISRLDADGTWSGLFGLVSAFNGFATQGSATGQFSRPEGVAFDAAGNAWVADTGNDRVVEIVPATGAVAFTSPAGALSGPRAIARDASGGGVVVADTGNDRVVAIAPGGGVTLLRSSLSHPAAVAVGGPGSTLYAADDTHVLQVASGVQVAPPPGSGVWDHPAGLAVAADGTLYVSERRPGTPNGARIMRGVPSGAGFDWDTIATEGPGPSQVIEPAGLALSADGGTLLVADSGNDRVLRFDAPGSAPPVTHAVQVTVTGITRGTVTSAPEGISCLTDCVQHYGAGRQVTLTATPVAGSVLTGWSGACAPAGAATTCSLTVDGPLDVGAAFAPAPPPPAPPPPPPPPPTPAPTPRAPAKIRVLRAGVQGGVLDMLVEITSRALTSGAKLDLTYGSSGHTTKFSVPIAATSSAGGPHARAAETRVKIRRHLPASQRKKDTGIVELIYAGSSTVQPDKVRLRAASGKSLLTRKTSKIQNGRLIVSGTVTSRASGVVRIRLGYDNPDASTDFLYWNAKIAKGTWTLNRALPAAAAAGGQLAIQFTGYLPRNLRGEQTAKQVLS